MYGSGQPYVFSLTNPLLHKRWPGLLTGLHVRGCIHTCPLAGVHTHTLSRTLSHTHAHTHTHSHTHTPVAHPHCSGLLPKTSVASPACMTATVLMTLPAPPTPPAHTCPAAYSKVQQLQHLSVKAPLLDLARQTRWEVPEGEVVATWSLSPLRILRTPQSALPTLQGISPMSGGSQCPRSCPPSRCLHAPTVAVWMACRPS